MIELPDHRDRQLAVTTFDKNVVVTAGAGTGKTTLLVDRLTHLLMREPDPLRITDIVAITFTKKAANEMKIRLRGRLQYFVDRSKDGVKAFSDETLMSNGSQGGMKIPPPLSPLPQGEGKYEGTTANPPPLTGGGEGEGERRGFSGERTLYEDSLLQDIMARYNLGMDKIAERAADAINNLEKAQIGTIHSFTGHILRLYPLESGLDPDFEEDEGNAFEEHFEREWEGWLDAELSSGSVRKEKWKGVLRRVSISDLEKFTKELCGESVPVLSLEEEMSGGGIGNGRMFEWLRQETHKAKVILEQYTKEHIRKVKMHSLLGVSIEVFEKLISGSQTILFNESIPSKNPKDWLEDDYDEAIRIVSIARALTAADDSFIQHILELILPFISSFRKKFVASGKMSFDGLLSYCCELLKNRIDIRNNLKRNFSAILVDEFQDTDPLQYEIILYLAEIEGGVEQDVKKIMPAPGKIFIVGDPKQSIYAFRGADIEAYHKVVDRIVNMDGVRANLSTNFRSHNEIINLVNSAFSRIIRKRDLLQPEYVDIAECPGHNAVRPLQRVEIRLVDMRNKDESDSAEAVECEAMAIGKWLKEEVIGKEIITGSDGGEAPVSPRHVAILLRKLTQVHEYLDVFKRLGIPYIVEGERNFYGAQEVIDFVNLLRVLDNPWDSVALAGVLRSPLGGLSDRELYELSRLSLLDYRRIKDGKLNECMKNLYSLLNSLADNINMMPVPEAIHYIFDNTPVMELAASSYHGEQAVANLLKIYKIAESLSDKSNLTLKGFTALLEQRVAGMEEEGESLLSEEGVDAVRILSIHKAKGLEFPIVVLGGIHGVPYRGGDAASVMYHWMTRTLGLRVSGIWNSADVMLQDRKEMREEEEQKRLLYVAMTRAKECLVLSGVMSDKIDRGSFLYRIQSLSGDALGNSSYNSIEIGEARMKQTVIDYRLCSSPEVSKKDFRKSDEITTPEWIEQLSGMWRSRDHMYQSIKKRRLFITPSRLEEDNVTAFSKKIKSAGSELSTVKRSILTGNIAHYILEQWDFANDAAKFKMVVEDACRKFMPAGNEGYDQFALVVSELKDMFESFSKSPAYEELKRVEILGREVPFTIPWNGQVMEGVIDLVYRDIDSIYAADYKTDRISDDEIADKMKAYSVSGKIYAEAVKRCIGADAAGCKLIFLRSGKSVDVI